MANRTSKVTESIFNAVKTLLKGGATVKECAGYMGLSAGTINVIKASETFEEYKSNMFLRSRACHGEKKQEQKPEQKPEPVQTVGHKVVVQASHFMLEEQKKTNELLTLISNKLAFIVDELTK